MPEEGKDEEIVEQTTETQGGETEPSTETPPAEQHEDPAEALRAMREDSERLREQANFFRTMAMRNNPQPQRTQRVERDPNEYVTAGDFQSVDDRFASIEEKMRAQHDRNCENAARAKFSDFDDVVMKYTLPAVRADKRLMDAIDSADDPAMAAYMFGRTSEQYMTDQSKITAQNVASKIEKNLKKPGTLGQVKSGKPEAQEKSPKDMTPEEFKAFRLKTVGFE